MQQTGSLVIFGAIASILAILLSTLSTARSDLERHLQELSTLNEISRALKSSLDLGNLLNAIHIQVSKLLGVDNFYIAIYDFNDRQIWYPLALKHGQRQHWPRRPLTNRLTDRVIQEGKPILITHDASKELVRIGLPSGEDAPYAWIGVPLIVSERAIGCLASFSTSSNVEFHQADLDLLTIISGQTSVAIEIALQNALLTTDVAIGRDRLSAVINSVAEGIVMLGEKGQIMLANQAMETIAGLPQSDFIGKDLSDLPLQFLKLVGYTQEEARVLWQNLKQEKSLHPDKVTYSVLELTPEKIIERTIMPVLSQVGQPIGWLLVLRDVTDEHLARRARDLISETLVHDLRSPISAILVALDVTEDALLNKDPAGISFSSIKIARRSAQRVLGLVESLLEISRMQTGDIELSLAPVNLKVLISQVLTEFSNQAREIGLSLKDETPLDLPTVNIDQNKITRVLVNLVDNALKFTPAKGRILVSAEVTPQACVAVHVSDTGLGIPKELREKIFDRFSQVPGQASRRRGYGLGLTFCRLVVKAHGGDIWVEANPQVGSRFTFTLPIQDQTHSEVLTNLKQKIKESPSP